MVTFIIYREKRILSSDLRGKSRIEGRFSRRFPPFDTPCGLLRVKSANVNRTNLQSTIMQTGTYILLLHLPADAELDIPGLGKIAFPAGFYAYADSAFGIDTLPGRIKSHLAEPTTPREHIDFLRQVAHVAEIWMAPGSEPHEHDWVSLLLEIPGAVAIADGFGVEDCTCDSHLVYFDVRPLLEDFQIGVRGMFPDEPIIRAKTDERN